MKTIPTNGSNFLELLDLNFWRRLKIVDNMHLIN